MRWHRFKFKRNGSLKGTGSATSRLQCGDLTGVTADKRSGLSRLETGRPRGVFYLTLVLIRILTPVMFSPLVFPPFMFSPLAMAHAFSLAIPFR
jgi:hypothetical protein